MNKSNITRTRKHPLTKVYRFKEQFRAATLKEEPFHRETNEKAKDVDEIATEKETE